jgi:uncharacterized protein YndB with AHSA1/START domain
MEKLHFRVSIDAPVHTVWRTMLEPDSYRLWTSAFHEGSYFVGDWHLGSEIRFLGPSDDEGTPDGGLFGRIVANRPDEFVSIEYDGMVVDGVDDTTSAFARAIAGTHENYTFREVDGVTTVIVEMDADPAMADMMNESWPVALGELTRLAEGAEREPEEG